MLQAHCVLRFCVVDKAREARLQRHAGPAGASMLAVRERKSALKTAKHGRHAWASRASRPHRADERADNVARASPDKHR